MPLTMVVIVIRFIVRRPGLMPHNYGPISADSCMNRRRKGAIYCTNAHFVIRLRGRDREGLHIDDSCRPRRARAKSDAVAFPSTLPAMPEYEQATELPDRQRGGLWDHHHGRRVHRIDIPTVKLEAPNRRISGERLAIGVEHGKSLRMPRRRWADLHHIIAYSLSVPWRPCDLVTRAKDLFQSFTIP